MLEGELSVFSYVQNSATKEEEKKLTATLKRGQAFGEEYVLNPTKPFNHLVKSLGPCKVHNTLSSPFSLLSFFLLLSVSSFLADSPRLSSVLPLLCSSAFSLSSGAFSSLSV